MLRSSGSKGEESAGCRYGSSHFSVLYNTSSADNYGGVISQFSMYKILLPLKSCPRRARVILILLFLCWLW